MAFQINIFFYGFFPEKNKDLVKDLNVLSNLNCSLVFFVSPYKVNKAINSIKEFFFDRKILICREISKFYEEYLRNSVKDIELFSKPPKGELTIVLSEKELVQNKSKSLSESDKQYIKKMIKTLSIKDITNFLFKNKNIPKKLIYNYCLKIKNENK